MIKKFTNLKGTFFILWDKNQKLQRKSHDVMRKRLKFVRKLCHINRKYFYKKILHPVQQKKYCYKYK